MNDYAYRQLSPLVTQKRTIEKPSDRPLCPLCGAKIVERSGRTTTLLGGGDGTVDGDPNHTWEAMTCADGHRVTRQTKQGRVWWTGIGADLTVLKGWFECFEGHFYTCATCAGLVTRYYTKLDGITPHVSGSLSYGPEGPGQLEWWGCEGCGAKVQTTANPKEKPDA